MYPNDAAVVSRAIEQAKNVRLGYRPRRGISALTPDYTLGQTAWADAAGNSGINNADGTNYRLDMALSNKAAWMQPAVYVAAGAGVVLGIAGFLAYKKYGRK